MIRNLMFAAQTVFLGLLAATATHADKSTQQRTVLKDCPQCPELAMLPAGSFTMGSPDDEAGRQADEGPLHTVTFSAPFAVSRFHITVAEWTAFAKETGLILKDGDTRPGRECKAGKPRYPQTPRHPVVCLDFHDAQAYIEWLARKTGKPYRMISEAEWEYAARAGSAGPFPFPFDDERNYAIYSHANTYGDKDGYSHVAPVGSFPANAFGMHDMHGNVHEWVADCLHENYVGAPKNGSAWMEDNGGDCRWHQIRGNDWIEPSVFSRSANRNDRAPSIRGDWISFRVVRPL